MIWSENALLGIDDVDPGGNIEAKIPVPDGGGTTTASIQTDNTAQLRFIERDERTASFEFDGQTLTAATGSENTG